MNKQSIEYKLELMKHIFNGGAIQDDVNGGTFTYDRLSNDKPEEDNEYLMFVNMDNCSIYLSDKDKRILGLEAQLADMNIKLQIALEQKRIMAKNAREQQEEIDEQSQSNTAVYRAHLKHDEVHEIEEIFKRDFRTRGVVIMNAYGVSSSVASNIRLGKHTKSSDKYITHLKNIGQWKGTINV